MPPTSIQPNPMQPFAPAVEAAIRAIVQEELSILLARMYQQRVLAVPAAPIADEPDGPPAE